MPLDFHSEPAVVVTRGGQVESIHHAVVAVTRADGQLLYSLGDPHLVTFLRSSAKPFQAIPIVESGAFAHYGFSLQELAVMCASHNGQPMHTETVQGILDRLGLDATNLLCGVHAPFFAPTAREMRERGEEPTTLHNNCSGKHAGMLALAMHLGLGPGDYRPIDHPVQVLNRETLADLAGIPADSILTAVDGCSVPTFALPMSAAARAYARLLDPSGLSKARQRAVETVVQAMQAYPEMVGGDDRIDTWLMQAAPNVVSKGGAEGYQGIAALVGLQALGLTMRIADGDLTNRSKGPLIMSTLEQTEAVSAEVLEAGRRWDHSIIKNRHGDDVGDIHAEFTLTRHT